LTGEQLDILARFLFQLINILISDSTHTCIQWQDEKNIEKWYSTSNKFNVIAVWQTKNDDRE